MKQIEWISALPSADLVRIARNVPSLLTSLLNFVKEAIGFSATTAGYLIKTILLYNGAIPATHFIQLWQWLPHCKSCLFDIVIQESRQCFSNSHLSFDHGISGCQSPLIHAKISIMNSTTRLKNDENKNGRGRAKTLVS